jgi:YHS domain-containing protein
VGDNLIIMEFYNVEKLVRVKYREASQSNWLTYKKEWKLFKITLRKEGIYFRLFSSDYMGKEYENHTVKDGIVWADSTVTLSYQGGYSKTYFFKSEEKAKQFAESFAIGDKWIN